MSDINSQINELRSMVNRLAAKIDGRELPAEDTSLTTTDANTSNRNSLLLLILIIILVILFFKNYKIEISKR